MADRKRTEALRTTTEQMAGSPTTPDPEVGPVTADDCIENEVQLSLRLRPALKAAILDEARQRRVTVKALVLGALRDVGLPVDESDLLDRRDGAPRRAREPLGAGPMATPHVARRPSASHSSLAPTSAAMPDLAAFAALLTDFMNRRTGAGTGPNIRISTGCCCGHQPAVKQNSSNRLRRRK